MPCLGQFNEAAFKMRDEYNISGLHPRPNPYVSKTKINLCLDESTRLYFESLAEETGLSIHVLIQRCLNDCAKNKWTTEFP